LLLHLSADVAAVAGVAAANVAAAAAAGVAASAAAVVVGFSSIMRHSVVAIIFCFMLT